MNDPATHPNTPATPVSGVSMAPRHKDAVLFQSSWKSALGVAIAMVVLALLGVGLSTTNPSAARTYWVSLVPIYAALCVAVAWTRSRQGGSFTWTLVLRQVLHWLVIAVALGLDFYVRGTGQEASTASGLTALLLLSVGCFLAGVHLEWLFAVVGLLLAFTLVCVAKADQYMWVIFLAGGIAIVAMIGVIKLLGRSPSTTKAVEPSA